MFVSKGDLPRQLLPPPPCGHPVLTRDSTGDPSLVGSFGSVSCGVTASFLWILVQPRFSLCLPSLDSLFPPVLWKSCNQILLGFKVIFLGDSQSLCCVPRLGSLMWSSEPSQQWENFPTFGLPAWQILILLWLCPSYCLAMASSLSLNMGYIFLVGSRILLLMAFQQLTGGDEWTSFYSAIWTGSNSSAFYFMKQIMWRKFHHHHLPVCRSICISIFTEGQILYFVQGLHLLLFLMQDLTSVVILVLMKCQHFPVLNYHTSINHSGLSFQVLLFFSMFSKLLKERYELVHPSLPSLP